jgi:beta-lactamase regulating signal transducer with metallopeptidase domain
MIDFLIKSSISLIVFLGFYHLVLEREKMHHFNRFYLLISILISLAIPFFTFEIIEIVSMVQNIEPVSIGAISKSSENFVVDKIQNEIQVEETVNYFPYIILGLYLVITLMLSVRFGKNYFRLVSKIKSNPNIKYKNANLVLMEEKILPHTFLNAIFVNSEDFKNRNIEEELFTHELVHVTQKHTLDILFIEFLKIIFWFNPLFIFYKKAIQLNHEFLADEEIVKTYDNVPFYQNLLLQKGSGSQTIYLASNLNYLVTKKRLLMMTKNTSNKIALIKKIAIVPILAGLIYFFCIEIVAQEKVGNVNSEAKNLKLSDKDEIRDNYYSGVYVKIFDERTNRKSVTLYENLSIEDRRKYLDLVPKQIVEKKVTNELYNKLISNPNIVVKINDKFIKNTELTKYKPSDFKHQTYTTTYKKGDVKNFGKSHHYTLYTNAYFNKHLKNSHRYFPNDTIKIIWVSYETIKKDKIINKVPIDTAVWTVDGKEGYNVFVNDNKEEFVEDEKLREKRDFAYEDVIITIVDRERKINVTKKYEDLDLKIKQRYLRTHMFYKVDKRIPNQDLFERFKDEKKYLIVINDKRVENVVLNKMKRTDIYYFAEMVNPPTSTRDNVYYLYTKEFYESQLTAQLKSRTKKFKIEFD